jgi:hypothetical protein
MTNYRFDKRADGYIITERTSGLVIERNLTHPQAQTITRTLNRGGGFAGHTPPFFVEKIPVREAII